MLLNREAGSTFGRGLLYSEARPELILAGVDILCFRAPASQASSAHSKNAGAWAPRIIAMRDAGRRGRRALLPSTDSSRRSKLRVVRCNVCMLHGARCVSHATRRLRQSSCPTARSTGQTRTPGTIRAGGAGGGGPPSPCLRMRARAGDPRAVTGLQLSPQAPFASRRLAPLFVCSSVRARACFAFRALGRGCARRPHGAGAGFWVVF